MTAGRRVWMMIGGLVAAWLVAYGAYVLIDLLAMRSTVAPIELDGMASVNEINISGSGGGVRLVGADTDAITGELRIRSALRGPTHHESIDNGTLTLHADCPTFGSSVCSATYELSIPRSMAVVAHTSGGSIHVYGLSGPLDLDSSGGGITVRDSTGAVTANSSGGGITVAGSGDAPISADSSGGGVHLTDITADRVDVGSSGGGIEVTFVEAPQHVNADSSGGGVTVSVPNDDERYNIDASSSGGGTEVAVRTDPASARTIRVRSSGGSVHVRYAADEPVTG